MSSLDIAMIQFELKYNVKDYIKHKNLKSDGNENPKVTVYKPCTCYENVNGEMEPVVFCPAHGYANL